MAEEGTRGQLGKDLKDTSSKISTESHVTVCLPDFLVARVRCEFWTVKVDRRCGLRTAEGEAEMRRYYQMSRMVNLNPDEVLKGSGR